MAWVTYDLYNYKITLHSSEILGFLDIQFLSFSNAFFRFKTYSLRSFELIYSFTPYPNVCIYLKRKNRLWILLKSGINEIQHKPSSREAYKKRVKYIVAIVGVKQCSAKCSDAHMGFQNPPPEKTVISSIVWEVRA